LQEWLEVQNQRMELYYFQGTPSEIAEAAEKTRPVVMQHGTALQRASFYGKLCRLHFRRDRYVVSDETLAYAQAGLAASLELADSVEIATNQFVLGFAYLCRGDFDAADAELQAALSLAERIGDATIRVFCLTWQTIIHRRRGRVEEARHHVSRSLEAATAAGMPLYVATAKANLAWVNWREGDLAGARENGQAALEMWPKIYAFEWTARWPLIGIAMAQDRISEAVDCARGLLAPSQQRLPAALEGKVEQAVAAWEGDDREAARASLDQAVRLAQETGYL
jgi:tetratricopeptide (TPR) repeat protein